MAWIAITPERLADKAAELTSVKGVVVRPGQTADGIIADEIAAVIKVVRGYCPKTTSLGPEGTIPDELENDALAILRAICFTRIAVLSKFMNDDRRQEKKDALQRLKDWQRGDFTVISPEEEAAAQPPGPMVTFKSRKRRASSSAQDGLH